MRNGQDVVVFEPRRYGKSSLIWRARHELITEGPVRLGSRACTAARTNALDV